MRRIILATVVLIGILAVAACASRSPTPLPDPVELPTREQPSFRVIGYPSLPDGVEMISRLSTSDLENKLKERFPSLATERASLTLEQEELIDAGGIPYRRLWFYYGDEATLTMHGTCGQNIFVWLGAGGNVSDMYVDPLNCPI